MAPATRAKRRLRKRGAVTHDNYSQSDVWSGTAGAGSARIPSIAWLVDRRVERARHRPGRVAGSRRSPCALLPRCPRPMNAPSITERLRSASGSAEAHWFHGSLHVSCSRGAFLQRRKASKPNLDFNAETRHFVDDRMDAGAPTRVRGSSRCRRSATSWSACEPTAKNTMNACTSAAAPTTPDAAPPQAQDATRCKVHPDHRYPAKRRCTWLAEPSTS